MREDPTMEGGGGGGGRGGRGGGTSSSPVFRREGGFESGFLLNMPLRSTDVSSFSGEPGRRGAGNAETERAIEGMESREEESLVANLYAISQVSLRKDLT